MGKLTPKDLEEGALIKHVIEVYTVVREGEVIQTDDVVRIIEEGEVTSHVVYGSPHNYNGVNVDPRAPQVYVDSLCDAELRVRKEQALRAEQRDDEIENYWLKRDEDRVG